MARFKIPNHILMQPENLAALDRTFPRRQEIVLDRGVPSHTHRFYSVEGMINGEMLPPGDTIIELLFMSTGPNTVQIRWFIK
jgi:hypothetical protein